MSSYLKGLKADAELRASYAAEERELVRSLAFAFYFLTGAVLDLVRGY